MFAETICPERRGPGLHGAIGAWRVTADGLWVPRSRNHNQIQYQWGFIAAMTIGKGRRDYRISAMYIEFENVADPEDQVTVPSFDRGEGLEYYDDLALVSGRDFLRVSLLQEPTLGITQGYEEYFTAGESGNKLTFFALTSGSAGVHGRPFSSAANSKVCGAALVATPVFADRTQDVIFSRGYLATDGQVLKDASEQIGMTWDIGLE